MKKVILSISLFFCFSVAQAQVLTPLENSNYDSVRSEWYERGGTLASLRNFSDFSSGECLKAVFEHVDSGEFLAIKHHMTNYFYDKLVITHSTDRVVLDIDLPDDYSLFDCKVTIYPNDSRVELTPSADE